MDITAVDLLTVSTKLLICLSFGICHAPFLEHIWSRALKSRGLTLPRCKHH